MSGKLIQNLSANTIQLITNQAFGLLVFFILSANLSKRIFGDINLALAILLTAFNILSFGIDQVAVHKAASGEDPSSLLSAYLSHVAITGVLFYGTIVILNFIYPQILGSNQLLIFIGIGKLMLFFSMPFKQLAAGFEQFRPLARMSVASNIIRGLALLILALLHRITMHYVVLIFITGDTAELIFSILIFKYQVKIPVTIKWDGRYYLRLVKESITQVGSVIFSSALARFDWIFIGVMVSSTKLAEYSFAYKIFELSTLPLLALAPLLVPRFTQILKTKALPADDIALLVRVEMIVATATALLLFVCWAPVIDWATHGKYGAVNTTTIFILCLCMPLLYLNNFLWSISFAQGRLKMILGMVTLAFLVNISGDVVLIPILKNEGAALAYLLAMLIQYIAYSRNVIGVSNTWKVLFFCFACAIISGAIAMYLFKNSCVAPIVAAGLFFISLLICKQYKTTDWKNISHLLS